MPVYEFKCTECCKVTSELRTMSDFAPARCSFCGSNNTEKMFSLFAGKGKECGTCATSHAGG